MECSFDVESFLFSAVIKRNTAQRNFQVQNANFIEMQNANNKP